MLLLRWRLMVRWGIAFLAMLAAVIAGAAPIEMEGRTLLAAKEPGLAPHPAIVVHATPHEVEFIFPINDGVELDEGMWALHVRFAGELHAGPTLTSNGRLVMMDAFRRGDGYLFRLGPGHLKHGINRLRLDSRGAGELVVQDFILFSLRDTFEMVHFGVAFADRSRREAMTSAQPPSHPDQLRLDVLHYHLSLRPTMNSTFLRGEMTMTARATEEGLEQVVLDFDPNNGLMNVLGVDQGEGTDELAHEHNAADKRLYVQLPGAAALEEVFEVRVRYQGFPSTSGQLGPPYNRSSTGSHTIVYTLSQPYGARKWWPCKDTPDDKATLSTEVIVPASYTVVTNGRLVSTSVLPDSQKLWRHEHSYPIATYLVSMAIAAYSSESMTYTSRDGSTTMDVTSHSIPGTSAGHHLSRMESALAVFSELFVEYPFLSEKYDQAQITGSYAMEHQTATSTVFPSSTNVTIHEVAHHWFGNMVGFENHDHVWLSEGWATYCEGLYVEATEGPEAFEVWLNYRGLVGIGQGAHPLVHPDADAFHMNTVYLKGAAVLHTLRNWVGDEAFFAGARAYLTEHAYGTAVTADLRRAMETASGEDLEQFFDAWIHGAGQPQINWRWWREDGPQATVVVEVTERSSTPRFPFVVEAIVTVTGGERIRVQGRMEKGHVAMPVAIPAGMEVESVAISRLTCPPVGIPNEVVADQRMLRAIEGGFLVDFMPAMGMQQVHTVEFSTDGTTWEAFTPATPLKDREGRVFLPMDGNHLMTRIHVQGAQNVDWRTPVMSAHRGVGDTEVLMVRPLGLERPWYLDTAEIVGGLGHTVTMVTESYFLTPEIEDPPSAVIWLVQGRRLSAAAVPSHLWAIARILDGGVPTLVTGSGALSVYQQHGLYQGTFWEDYLKASVVQNQSSSLPIHGVEGQRLEGLSFVAQGDLDLTKIDFAPLDGAVRTAFSDRPLDAVAHEYVGPMPGNPEDVRLALASFNIDGIRELDVQEEVLRRMLDFLGLDSVPVEEAVGDWMSVE